MTVPIGMRMTSAIPLYEKPSISRKTRTSRKSTGSCSIASRTCVTACCCNSCASGSRAESAGYMAGSSVDATSDNDARRATRLYHAFRTIAISQARASWWRSEGRNRIARTHASWTTSSASASFRVSHRA